ncbi:MAG: response regulator [Proteobacteria bacterium]|nr:response regulator [Pseudomonadota bacterium]
MSVSKKPNILIVDDEERLRESLRKMLEMDCFEVDVAGNGHEALEKLLSGSFDVVLLDMIMPETDGMWFLDKVSQRKLDVGVIVLTGYGTVELAVEAMKLGAWDFVQKPVDYDLLSLMLQKALDRSAMAKKQKEYECRIREQNKELARANGKLKELDKLKTNFMAKAVHELRSPLTVMSCTLEIARDDMEELGAAPECLKYISSSIKTVRGMGDIVNEMLDMSMIISGKIKMQKERRDFFSFLKQIKEDFCPVVEKNKVGLFLDAPSGLGDLVFSEEKIRQVLLNLLSNAVKFTPCGGRINIVAKEGESDVRVSIIDTGSGIPSADINSVFDDFFRSESFEKSGAGLGLSISKKIIEAHGGKVWVESVEGKGSTFSFSLPR